MRKTIEEAKNLFESITCLRAEGVEFFSQREILDAIAGEANKGYDICKKALQQDVEACIENPIGKRHSGCRLCNCTDWKPEHNA